VSGKCDVFVPVGTFVPTLANDEVACIGVIHRVAIAGRTKVDVAACLVVLAVVLSANKILCGELEIRQIRHWLGCRSSESTSNGSEPKGNGRKGNHVNVLKYWWV